MFRYFLALPLLSLSIQASAQPVAIFYGNGVRNTEEQTFSAMKRFQEVVEADARFSSLEMDFHYSYNQTACIPGDGTGPDLGCILDIHEAYVQLINAEDASRFWLLSSGLGEINEQEMFERTANEVANPRPFTPDRAVDLSEHASTYGDHIGAGERVALVAHSQGNLFGNNVYELLTPPEQDAFGMVSVATPTDNVLGDNSLTAPYVLLGEDPIRRWYIPFPTFPWNVTNGGPVNNPSWLFHDFVNSYLAGINSKDKILLNLLGVIDSLTVPAEEAILIDFETFPGPDGILGTADDEATPSDCEFGICLPLGNQYASLGLTFTSGTLFEGQFFPNAPADNHFVSSEPLDVSFSVPVHSVSIDSFSAWSGVAYALDASGNVVATDVLTHPNPGSSTFHSGTLSVTSPEPIARFVVLAEGCTIGQLCDPILNLDNLRLRSLATCAPSPSGVVAFWPGDGDSQEIASGSHGTLQNGTTFAPGKVGQAFSFDGVDDYVSIPDSASLRQSGPFTVELWFKPEETLAFGTPKSPVFFRKGFFNSLGVENNGARIEVRGPVPRIWSVQNLWRGGTWYHVALTFSGSAYAIYVNGELESVLTNQPYSILNNFEEAFIGANFGPGNSAFWNGEIDELTIYDRVLSAGEIESIYLADSAGKCRP